MRGDAGDACDAWVKCAQWLLCSGLPLFPAATGCGAQPTKRHRTLRARGVGVRRRWHLVDGAQARCDAVRDTADGMSTPRLWCHVTTPSWWRVLWYRRRGRRHWRITLHRRKQVCERLLSSQLRARACVCVCVCVCACVRWCVCVL
jgi:hypothetical protein